ncbi:MAG TPA: hypothetical protein VFC42_14480 [Methylomirabilota bacterium]|nr:hypothetical protein [Methylomirabilota bacterium]
MRGTGAGRVVDRRRRARRAVALAVAAAIAGGCAALGAGPLDIPPGHRVVLGGLDLSRFDAPEALLEVIREDGTFRRDVRVDPAQRAFVTTLPPGRYRVARLRVVDSAQTSPDVIAYDLRLGFDVAAAPTVYIGTLRVIREFATRVRVEVLDEYDRTVPALRARHRDIPVPVERALMRAT